MKLSSRLALLTKLNAALRRILLSLWPEENKSWGLAFASESQAIDSPHKQLRWLLGGIPVLARQRFNSLLHSLHRPIGVAPDDLIQALPSQPGGRRPRTPRFVLALLFLVFVWLFWQPATRAVFRSVSESYAAQGWDPQRWPEVQRLQSLAQKGLTSKNPDPQLLAFVSLSYQDESKRLSMADFAVQADPSLSWIDFQNAVLPANDTTKQHALATSRIDRLLAADPGNAALYVLRAESIALPYFQKDAQADPKAFQVSTHGSLASHDPRWLAAMHDAFSAPRYDPYDHRLFQLAKNVMARYSVNDPRILLTILDQRPISQYQAMNTYTKILLSQASDEQRAGDTDSAIRSCSFALDFAERLRTADFFTLDARVANGIELQVLPRLQSLYESSGRHSRALVVAARLQENRDERAKFMSGLGLSRHALRYWSRAEWSALAMQTSVLAIWALVPLSLVAIILLWLLRIRLHIMHGFFHSLLCLLSDLCPSFLVLACAILFITYAPFDHTFRQLLHDPLYPASYAQFSSSVYAPFLLPSSVSGALDEVTGPEGQFLFWCALTALPIFVLVIILTRHLPKRPAVPPS